MSLLPVSKRLDQFRRNLFLLWRDAEDNVPEEFKPEVLEFRAASQKLLIRLGLIRSKKAGGKLIFDGDVVDPE